MSFEFMGNASTWTRRGFSPEDELGARMRGETAGPVHTAILNETGLPNDLVERAVRDYMQTEVFAEDASLAGAQSTFQTYVNDGSLLAKHRYRTPTNVIEEIRLARDLAERDDDIRAVIGGFVGLAFQHIQHHARDRRSALMAHKVASPKRMGLRRVLSEMYREYLIASSVTTVKILTPSVIQIPTSDTDVNFDKAPTLVPMKLLTPRVGVLPAENIRVVGSDMFGDRALAYWPGDDARLTKFLDEYFDPKTTAARKREMQTQDPISTRLFLQPVQVEDQQSFIPGQAFIAYLMNPSMVHRTSMGKGFWPYPRPLLASVFPLLEAKRLLNIMDFALLQGAANYVVVAKKGTDALPAHPNEVIAMREMVRHLGRTGVVVGDHRLDFEILTPELKDMLSPERRELIARRIVAALARKPISTIEDAGSEGALVEIEWICRVIEADRADLIEHVEEDIYEEMVQANPEFKSPPKIWCPKIILQGTQFFTDLVVKLRDRGDIPRKYAIEAAGFNFEAVLSERQWELDADVDEILMPAAVPYTVPAGVADPNAGPATKGPQDNNNGRPPGSRTGAGPDPGAPRKRTITRNAGETVKAWRRDDGNRTYRMGEVTHALIEEFAGTLSAGRLTAYEQSGLNGGSSGPLHIVKVNPAYADEVGELRVLRIGEHMSAYVGKLRNGSIVTRALSFRTPEYPERIDAVERAMELGFEVEEEQE